MTKEYSKMKLIANLIVASVLIAFAGISHDQVTTSSGVTGVLNLASPGPIGAGTASSGAFTTVTATTPIAPASGGTGVTTSTGTGSVVLNTTPTITTPNITGTVAAGNATAGSVGEVISSTITQGGAQSLTSPNTLNVTSIQLTAGDWDCNGNVNYTFGGATNVTAANGGISATSTTQPAIDKRGLLAQSAGFVPTNDVGFTVPYTRVNIASTLTYYLVGQMTFSVSTALAYGNISCRRAR